MPGHNPGNDDMYMVGSGSLRGLEEGEPATKQAGEGSAPPRLYRTLSRRSFGRYVLATSSLVCECARVYTPAPLDLLASSLLTRVSVALDSTMRNRVGASVGKKTSPSGLSYERFLSNDGTMMEEEELSGEALAVPPEKYGRVSSAFLARHAVGRVDLMAEEVAVEDVRPIRPPTSEGSNTNAVDIGPLPLKDTVSTLSRRTRLSGQPSPSTRSVLESLASLRINRRREGGDDLDLLSDSDDEEGLANVTAVENGVAGRGIGRKPTRLVRKTQIAPTSIDGRRVCSERTSSPASSSESRLSIEDVEDVVSPSRSGDPMARNLVSGADDNAAALIKRMREAAAGPKSLGEGVDNGRKLRKSPRGRPQRHVGKRNPGGTDE